MPILHPLGTGECEFRKMVELIIAASELTEVDQHIYRLAQHSQDKRPRNVVWVPLSTTVAEQDTDLPAQQLNVGLRVELLNEEWLVVQARITGVGDTDVDGFEDAERIRRNLIAAFVRVTREHGRKSEVGPSQWITQQDGQAAHAHGGAELVIQQFRFRVPIPKSTSSTTTISAATHTCTVNDNL